METLLQQFETPFVDRDGSAYGVFVYGRSRAHDTWQGWLVFERQRDGRRFATPVETTQPNGEAVRYWATGLTETYFEGALDRARKRGAPQQPVVATPPPLVDFGVDSAERDRRREAIEEDLLELFTESHSRRMLAQRAFDELPYAHADIVRALEHLEKEHRRVMRRTDEGNDWIELR